MCNLQKRMETSFLWLANSFFFCIGHFSKRRSRSSFASNFYPIITLCLTDCWNCLARGLILVPNSMYCLKVVFWVLFFASEELRNEQKLHLLLSSWKTVRIWKKKQKYQLTLPSAWYSTRMFWLRNELPYLCCKEFSSSPEVI